MSCAINTGKYLISMKKSIDNSQLCPYDKGIIDI